MKEDLWQQAREQGNRLLQSADEVNDWFSNWMNQLPQKQQETMVEIVDQLILHLSNLYQQKTRIEEIEKKILIEGRLFNSEIDIISEMDQLSLHQLEYIEEKFKSKYSLYSLIEGGVAGIGHPLCLLFDFPALLSINMKMVHSISSTYGFSLLYPSEQILALKVLHASSLSQKYHSEAWEWIVQQYEQEEEYSLYMHGQETIIQPEWLETLAKQWIKALGLYGMRKASKSKFPVLGIALGANLNYKFTKQVASFASEFYRYRFMKNQKGRVTDEYDRA
jgi:hypothetical protein